jgi:LuxR family transcriptional regulator, maltose regulon positive regulatory protein
VRRHRGHGRTIRRARPAHINRKSQPPVAIAYRDQNRLIDREHARVEAAFPFTKFVPPRLDDRVVVDRIVERLHAAVADHPLTVVAAPAGSGKTTALAAWARAAEGPVVWVRLGAEDAAPPVAAAALLEGVRREVGEFGSRLEQVLGRSQTAASAHHLLTALVNDLHDGPALCLALDDFHEIADAESAALFDALADHLPDGCRLVVASRTEPQLSLPRRRVRGELAELGLDDLRLDPATIRAVLGDDIDEAAVEALATGSGGWAAAVRLASAGALGQPDGLDPVGSVQPELWRFLADEVLDAQPSDLRAFLLDTAVLDELTPQACAAVTGRPDAGAVLSELDRRNLFLARFVSADGVAWRYHDLFAAFLRDHLRAERGEAQIADLHRRAADALPPALAVPHLLAAGEHERVAEIATEVALTDLDPGILAVVLPWVEALPGEVVERHPYLAFVLAWRDEILGRPEPIVARLEPLHTRLVEADDHLYAAEVAIQLAAAHMMTGDLEAAGRLLDHAEPQPLEGWSRVAMHILRTHWCRDSGDWFGASRALEAAFDVVLGDEDPGADRVLAQALSWTLLFADQGPGWMLERTERLDARLGEHGRLLSRTGLRAVLAAGALLRLDVATVADQTRRCLAESYEVGRLAWTHQEAETLLLGLALVAEDHATVRAVVQEALARMPTSPLDAATRYSYAHAALRSAWQRGNAAGIGFVLDLLAEPARDEEEVVRAQAQALAARQSGRGQDGLDALAEAEAAQRRLRCWLGAGLPGLERAAILLEAGHAADALAAAEPTLATAADLGAGILLPDGGCHRDLLRRCAGAGLHAEVAQAALDTLDRRAAPAAVEVPGTGEALSAREVEVLTHVARGRSNREIAEDLFISEVTVKSHLTRILRKLDATSRTHAAARARELHLL